MIKAVIFDLDGVISNTDLTRFSTLRELLKERGIDLDQSLYPESIGERTEVFLRKHYGNALSDEEITTINGKRKSLIRQFPEKYIQAMPAVKQCLETLNDSSLIFAVASSANRDIIDITLKTLKIAQYFKVIVGSDEISKSKPDPETYLKCIEKLSLGSEECVAVEDSVPGIKSAKAAGVKCIAVTYSHPRELLKDADLIIDSLEELTPEHLRG